MPDPAETSGAGMTVHVKPHVKEKLGGTHR